VSDTTPKEFPAFLKSFTGFFRLKVIEVKLGNLVTFQLDGGAEYFSSGDLFTAAFNPLAADEIKEKGK
jgi:hypothetical protein